MKRLLLIITILGCACARADDVCLGDTKKTHEREHYVWIVSRERLEKTPIWKKGKPLPLTAEKAEELAFTWSRRQTLFGLIPERPYRISLVAVPSLEDRYYYKVAFVDVEGDSFWTVYILLDGFIVEPKEIGPNQALLPTPTAVTPPAAQEPRQP